MSAAGELSIQFIQQNHIQAAALGRRDVGESIGRKRTWRRRGSFRMLETKIAYLLWPAIFQDREISGLKVGNRHALAICNYYIHYHQPGIGFQYGSGLLILRGGLVRQRVS